MGQIRTKRSLDKLSLYPAGGGETAQISDLDAVTGVVCHSISIDGGIPIVTGCDLLQSFLHQICYLTLDCSDIDPVLPVCLCNIAHKPELLKGDQMRCKADYPMSWTKAAFPKHLGLLRVGFFFAKILNFESPPIVSYWGAYVY